MIGYRSLPIVCELTSVIGADNVQSCSESLAAIDAHSNSPPWSADHFAAEFNYDHSRTFGARLGGEIVGFLIAHVTLDEAHIVNFAVCSANRGAGVGRAMLNEVLEQLFESGIYRVTLEVRRSNQVARALYESFAFSEVGLREHYYSDNGEDGVVLALNLALRQCANVAVGNTR